MKLAPIFAMWLLASSALAHDAMGPHGGQQVDAGGKHIELTTKGTSVDVYLADGDGKAMDATAYKGVAILMVAGKPARIPLAPAGGDRLSGTAPADIPPPARGAVLVTAPDGATIQGKFN